MATALSTRRLLAVSAALFLVILAFLAGRVYGGADPTQATTPASNVTQTDPAPAGTDSYGADPYGTPGGSAPPEYGPDEGGAVPDLGGAVPDPDPPSTSAS